MSRIIKKKEVGKDIANKLKKLISEYEYDEENEQDKGDISPNLETWALVNWNGLEHDKIITKALGPRHSKTQDKDAHDVEIKC